MCCNLFSYDESQSKQGLEHIHKGWEHMDGLVQERCNSIANALELRLSCTNPLIYSGDTLTFWRYFQMHLIERKRLYVIQISLMFFPKSTINKSLLVELMAYQLLSKKPLLEAFVTNASHGLSVWTHCGIMMTYGGDKDLDQPLAHVMAWCLTGWKTATNHQWCSVAFIWEQFHKMSSRTNPQHLFRNYTFKITTTPPRGQWLHHWCIVRFYIRTGSLNFVLRFQESVLLCFLTRTQLDLVLM